MVKKHYGSFVALAVGGLLLGGITRAATSRHEQQRNALYAQCEAERKRLGLWIDPKRAFAEPSEQDVRKRKTLYAKYPTPEITLCPLIRVLPGATAEVAVKGKFVPGTKFISDNDNVQIAREALSASEYRASVKVLPTAAPAVAMLEASTPVSCAHDFCQAIYVGGKYEWEFTSTNGWRIKLKTLHEAFFSGANKPPLTLLRADFYRGAETAPFQQLFARLMLDVSRARLVSSFNQLSDQEQEMVMAGDREFSTKMKQKAEAEHQKYLAGQGKIKAEAREAGKKLQAEMDKVQQKYKPDMNKALAEVQAVAQKMGDPKLSDRQRENLMAQMEKASAGMQEIQKKQEQEMKAVMEGRQVTGLEQEFQEFGCGEISFELKRGQLEGTARCGEKVGDKGQLPLKGTVKYLGP